MEDIPQIVKGLEPMTPQEAAERFTKEDGSIVLPANIQIIQPRRTQTASQAIAEARKNFQSKE